MSTSLASEVEEPEFDIAAIVADPVMREAFVDDLLARVETATAKVAWIHAINEAYPGEAHNLGGAFENIRRARFALQVAENLSPARSAR